jgi:hypothetical protein
MIVSRRRLLRAGGVGVIAGLAGCSGRRDESSQGESTAVDMADAAVAESPGTPGSCEDSFEVAGRITEDTTWPCGRYVMQGDVVVDDGVTLTIDPGAEVVAAQSVRLVVRDGGVLVAEGTESAPVVFRGEQEVAGYWEGIEVDSGAAGSRLVYTHIAHGGGGGWANVYLRNGATVALRNGTLRDSSTYGVVGESDASFTEFATNSFADNEQGAVRLTADALGTLDAASRYADGTGRGRIEVVGGDVTRPSTWPATDVPIHFSSTTRIKDAAVAVEPGAQFTFGQDTHLVVKEESSLSAVGDAARISFVGEQEVVGYWRGIAFESLDPDNVLDNCLVAHGGSGDWANVYLRHGATTALRNCEIRDSSTYGVVAQRGASFAEFTTNTFASNARGAVQLLDEALGALDSESTYAGGTGRDRIEVVGRDVTAAATWPAADVPIHFASTSRLRNAISVEPGARLTFGQGVQLSVEEEGSLTAIGDGAPISFVGEVAAPGYWHGVVFRSRNPDNVLDNCLVAHGGFGDWANVYVDIGAMVTVRNCDIRESSTHGIVVRSDGRLNATGNTFSNNVEGNIRND